METYPADSTPDASQKKSNTWLIIVIGLLVYFLPLCPGCPGLWGGVFPVSKK